MNTALSPIKTLIVTIMNHRKILYRPFIKRMSVKANEVLLQVAANIENVPVRFPMTPRVGKCSRGTSQTCFPSPLLTLKVTKAMDAASIICPKLSEAVSTQ